MRAGRLLGLLSALGVALGVTPGHTQAVSTNDPAARCVALSASDLSEIPDAPSQITAAKEVEPSGDAIGYCEVSGYVAPNVGFLLRLPPHNWNGKFVELGCGGSCGTTAHISACDDPLRRGYACIVSDGGHTSNGGELTWADHNAQAVIEYLVRASHVTALAGKAIAQRYYDRSPHKSYFMGCSAGGLQAMWEAERFPWDFDGIVAGGPDVHLRGIWTNWLWANHALTDENGQAVFGKADLELLHQAVVAKCDMNDGIKDGLIGDPRRCTFDPAELQCTAGKTSGCLTTRQVQAAERIYSGPATTDGAQIDRPIAMKGSELSWLDFFGGSAASSTPFYSYLRDWSRYSIFPLNFGSSWEPRNFDFDRDYKRLGAMEALEPNNADLRRFKGAGGKLLMYTGWNDAIEGVLNTVAYYETAEKILGDRPATQDFLRLFVIPGMNHCSGGDGAFAVDYLSYLEAWVEKGSPPEQLVASHVKLEDLKFDNPKDVHEMVRRLEFPLDPATVSFSRPVYPYPVATKYLGHGDSKDAASFGPKVQ
jgi:hypothetical protein